MKKRRNRSPSGLHETAAALVGQRQFRIEPDCFEDLRYWVEHDSRLAGRIMRLMEAARRNPFDGIGKPEPLTGEAGVWSRRITDEHRLTYRVADAHIHFLQARFHYSK